MLSLVALLPCVTAMPLRPTGAGQADRAARRAGTVLQADKVVLQSARDNREQLWLAGNLRTTLWDLLERQVPDPEAVCDALVAYGKDLYRSGKSYRRYPEAIKQCLPVALLCGGKLELRGTSHLTGSLMGPRSLQRMPSTSGERADGLAQEL